MPSDKSENLPKHIPRKREKSPQDSLSEEIQKLPPEIRGKIILGVSQFQGPLPPPDILEKYDAIVPGAANRIIEGSEAERKHRHGVENTVVRTESIQRVIGPFYGLVVSLAAMGLAGYALHLGFPVTAASIAGFTLVSLATVFVTGKLPFARGVPLPPEDSNPPQDS